MTTDAQADTPAPDTTPAVPADPAAIAARDQELTQLFEQDPNKYHYEDNGRWANEHYELRKASQPKNGEQEGAEQAEGDDLADVDVSAIDLEAPADGPEDDAAEAAEGDAEAAEASDLPYDLPEVKGYEWSDADRAAINTHWPELNELAVVERDALLSRYAGLRVQMERNDKAETKAATDALAKSWGGREAFKGNIREIKTFLGDEKRVSPALAARIANARTPSGGRLVNDPEFAQLLLQAARGQPGRQHDRHHTSQQGGDRTMAMQQELAELTALRDRDIDEYLRPWKATGKSGSDRALELTRELGSEGPIRPSASDLRAEQRELEALRTRDIQLFMFGDWKGSGRPAADRLVAIQMGRG